MTSNELNESLSEYKTQLEQVELTLSSATENDRENLLSLREDLKQLIYLTQENLGKIEQNPENSNEEASTSLDDEYQTFMAEMSQVGALEVKSETNQPEHQNLEEDFKTLENMKCQAPFSHQMHGVSYHNALVCGVLSNEEQEFENIQVRVMFTNPIYQEMVPCPYFLDSECKFSDEKCRFSHGEIVSLASLKEYKEPNFESLKVGDRVLVKLSTNKLWQLASVLAVSENQTCTVRTDSSKQEHDLNLENVFPLDGSEDEDGSSISSDTSEDSQSDVEYDENVIQQSLLNTPPSQALGDWEKYTKGIGSKLLQKMGYVVGTGLGLKSDGRLEPVDAVLLPTGKSLDHCMELREKSGGDKNFFKVEKKLKQLQRKQEEQSRRAYEREKTKTDVFSFLNDTLKHKRGNQSLPKDDPTKSGFSKSKHRRSLQTESVRQLNVNSIKIDEDIRRCQDDLEKIVESLSRHSGNKSVMNKNLKARLIAKQTELDNLRECERNIQNEQSIRRDKKKLTIF